MKQIILYQAKIGFWHVDASLLENGDLLIISGSLDNEWHCTVAAAHLPLLLATLMKDEPSLATIPADPRVLDALMRRFGGDQNPYEDILRFLQEHAIPMTTTAWLSCD